MLLYAAYNNLSSGVFTWYSAGKTFRRLSSMQKSYQPITEYNGPRELDQGFQNNRESDMIDKTGKGDPNHVAHNV